MDAIMLGGEKMKAIRLPKIESKEIEELDALYRTTRNVRIRERAQMVLLAVEKEMIAAEIAEIVRKDEQTVRTWLKRYQAEGTKGLEDSPREGSPVKGDEAYRQKLLQVVRQHPRSLDQPYSMWTLRRLADYMAEQTGIRLSYEAVRLYLKAGDIVMSRPQHTISSPDPDYQVKKR
jgi:transposase